MNETTSMEQTDVAVLTADLVSAYVSNNSVRASDLPDLILLVHAAFVGLSGSAAASAEPEVEKPTPAQIKKSITPDALISFIDGKPYKMLRRHLATHGLDIDTYRARYGLPSDYPTVAVNYSAARSALAKDLGLGQQRWKAAPEATPAPIVETAPAKAPRKARSKKAAQPVLAE